MSRSLKTANLISYWTNNPFLWILIEPIGDIFKVEEIPGDDERGIEIKYA